MTSITYCMYSVFLYYVCGILNCGKRSEATKIYITLIETEIKFAADQSELISTSLIFTLRKTKVFHIPFHLLRKPTLRNVCFWICSFLLNIPFVRVKKRQSQSPLGTRVQCNASVSFRLVTPSQYCLLISVVYTSYFPRCRSSSLSSDSSFSCR